MRRKVRFLVSAANPNWGAFRAKDETILDTEVAEGLIAGGLVEDLGEVAERKPKPVEKSDSEPQTVETPEDIEPVIEMPEKKRGKK